MNNGCTKLLRGDLRFQRNHSQLIIFCVAKPLRDLLQNHSGTSCYPVMRADLVSERWMLGKFDFHSLESVETVACYLSVRKLKTRVWLKVSGIAEQREKAAMKVGCTSSTEDGKEILVLVDNRGHWIPKMSQCQDERTSL